MIWSLSDSKIYRRCPRQWCYKTMAHWKAKDSFRQNLYSLTKLQTLSAWRGSVVDTVIAETLVPSWRRKQGVSLERAVSEARRLYQLQLDFALSHRMREQGMTPKLGGDAYAAFYEIEYGTPITNEDLDRAWEEIERALTTLYQLPALIRTLMSSSFLIAQRTLQYDCLGMNIRAVPDLIAFFVGRPPLIIDWKTYISDSQEHWLQLAVYSVALTSCVPHIDFTGFMPWEATDIGLLEVQLLSGQQRRYGLTDDDVQDAETYIAESALEMRLALGQAATGQLRPEDFPAARYPEACSDCPFRRPCWKQADPGRPV